MSKLEVWKDIENFPNYQISNLGRVKSKERYTKAKDNMIIHRKEKILKFGSNQKGYLQVGITNGNNYRTFKVHRLVAQAFIPNPENKPQVNHKNGIKTDNRMENLEWCTALENNHHAVKNGFVDLKLRKDNMKKLGLKNCGKNARKKIIQYDKNNNFIKCWSSVVEASKILNITVSNIYNCVAKNRKTAGGFIWKYYGKGDYKC